MVQTNPAAAMLGIKPNDNGLGGSNKSGDDGAFSREFEQVARSAEPRHSKDGATVATASAENSPSHAVKADDQESSDQASLRNEAEQAEIAASGKSLPPVATLEEDEVLLEGDEEALADIQEDAQAIMQTLVQQDAKQVLTTTTESKSVVAPVMITKGADAIAEPGTDADEAFSFSSLRLRDLTLLTQPGAGNDAGGQTALRQGKSDTALFTLVNNSGSNQGNFGEMLNLSTANGIAAAVPGQTSTSSLPAQMTLALPVQQSGWDQAMGERVVWMARSNIQQAQIQLNPRELGPIEIKISMQNDQTHVNFVAHHATTREAIEAALPRLREMLGEQGLNLGQADVSQHSFGDSQRQAGVGDEGRHLSGSQAGPSENEVEGEVVLHESRVAVGAVDYFA